MFQSAKQHKQAPSQLPDVEMRSQHERATRFDVVNHSVGRDQYSRIFPTILAMTGPPHTASLNGVAGRDAI